MTEFETIGRTDRVGLSRSDINNNFRKLETEIIDKMGGFDWQKSVISFTDETTGIEVIGNRYIADSDSATWTKDYIYEWGLPVGGSSSGSVEWLETIPDAGTAVFVEDDDQSYIYIESWVSLFKGIEHNDLSGIQGGSSDERYHMNISQINILTLNVDAQSLHYHDTKVSAPPSNTDTGIKGQWAVDSNYYYTCTSTNVWVRQPVETDFLYTEPESSSSSSEGA